MAFPASQEHPRVEQYETLTPEFRLRVDGADLAPGLQADLIAVSVVEDVDATGMFALSLQGWDGVQMKVKWIDDDLFREGHAVEVQMGYRDALASLFKGEITGLEPEFPEKLAPVLTVRGHDLRHRLMRARRTRSFTNMKDSDIVSEVASGSGLSASVEDTRLTHAYVLQHNQTDLEFLQQRADRLGYEVGMDDRKLVFRARKLDERATLTLRREIELLEFYPRLTTMGQVPELVVQGWSPAKKDRIEAKAAAGDEPALMDGSASGPSAARRAFGNASPAVVDVPIEGQAEADQLARGWLGEKALRYIRAEGVCIGEPRLRAGKVVNIEGIGQRFSGRYYVTWTEHRYRPRVGYRTAFSARRNAT